jgi:hypothetical protein
MLNPRENAYDLAPVALHQMLDLGIKTFLLLFLPSGWPVAVLGVHLEVLLVVPVVMRVKHPVPEVKVYFLFPIQQLVVVVEAIPSHPLTFCCLRLPRISF